MGLVPHTTPHFRCKGQATLYIQYVHSAQKRSLPQQPRRITLHFIFEGFQDGAVSHDRTLASSAARNSSTIKGKRVRSLKRGAGGGSVQPLHTHSVPVMSFSLPLSVHAHAHARVLVCVCVCVCVRACVYMCVCV